MGKPARLGAIGLIDKREGIIAGCHRVSWEEVERLAKLEGVIK